MCGIKQGRVSECWLTKFWEFYSPPGIDQGWNSFTLFSLLTHCFSHFDFHFCLRVSSHPVRKSISTEYIYIHHGGGRKELQSSKLNLRMREKEWEWVGKDNMNCQTSLSEFSPLSIHFLSPLILCPGKRFHKGKKTNFPWKEEIGWRKNYFLISSLITHNPVKLKEK